MGVDVVTAANPAQCETKRFDETAEIGKSDISQVTRCNAIPELLSPRTRHSGNIGSVLSHIDDKIAIIVC
jgi:hypothetical protein